MQKYVNLADLAKSFPTSIYLQTSASIQPSTSLSNQGRDSIHVVIRLLLHRLLFSPPAVICTGAPDLHEARYSFFCLHPHALLRFCFPFGVSVRCACVNVCHCGVLCCSVRVRPVCSCTDLNCSKTEVKHHIWQAFAEFLLVTHISHRSEE